MSMKKRIISTTTALLMAAANVSAAIPVNVSAEQTDHDKAAEITASMPLRQKLTQMIMLDIRYWSEDGTSENNVGVTELNDNLREELEKYSFAGILLFAQNVVGTEQTARLTYDLQEAASKNEFGLPLIISADQEGGRIIRLGTGTDTCGNMALGAAGDPQYAYENAYIIGSELSAIGINNNYAPVMDVNCNPANPVINVRSFSSDPQIVSEMGVEYIRGLADTNVCSTAKHFPGHGDTDVDSHTGLPLIDKSYDELKETELVPFSAAIDADVDMIMTAHIQFPQIETETYTSTSSGEEIYLPATLSKTILTDILRDDMGFEGIVVTDAMDMDAVAKNFDRYDTAALAINAGADILLAPVVTHSEEGLNDFEEYLDELEKRVEDGTISEDRINESVTRIIELKLEKGLADYDKDVEHMVDNALGIVGSKEHHDKELEITNKAITLIKNDDDLLPLSMGENDTAAFFAWNPKTINYFDYTFNMVKKEGIVPESASGEYYSFKEKTAADFENEVDKASTIILCLECMGESSLDPSNSDGEDAKFFDEITEIAHSKGKKVIVISMLLPYDVARYNEADAILASYSRLNVDSVPTELNGEANSYSPNTVSALLTVFGGNTPTGKLPVDVYTVDENYKFTDEILYPIGYGLTYNTNDAYLTEEEEDNSEEQADVSAEPVVQSDETAVAAEPSEDIPHTGNTRTAIPVAVGIVTLGILFMSSKKNERK